GGARGGGGRGDGRHLPGRRTGLRGGRGLRCRRGLSGRGRLRGRGGAERDHGGLRRQPHRGGALGRALRGGRRLRVRRRPAHGGLLRGRGRGRRRAGALVGGGVGSRGSRTRGAGRSGAGRSGGGPPDERLGDLVPGGRAVVGIGLRYRRGPLLGSLRLLRGGPRRLLGRPILVGDHLVQLGGLALVEVVVLVGLQGAGLV